MYFTMSVGYAVSGNAIMIVAWQPKTCANLISYD